MFNSTVTGGNRPKAASGQLDGKLIASAFCIDFLQQLSFAVFRVA